MINNKLEALYLWLNNTGLPVESDFIRKLSSDGAERFVDEGLVSGRWGSAASGLLITDGKRILLLKRSESVMDFIGFRWRGDAWYMSVLYLNDRGEALACNSRTSFGGLVSEEAHIRARELCSCGEPR